MGTLLALDIGERRIGVARANTIAKIAEPLTTLENAGSFTQKLNQLIDEHNPEVIVVGVPRNMSGEDTAQTVYVEQFVSNLNLSVPVEFQDEAVTSVHAEERLKSRGKPFSKQDIDAEAASIILQDYLEGMR